MMRKPIYHCKDWHACHMRPARHRGGKQAEKVCFPAAVRKSQLQMLSCHVEHLVMVKAPYHHEKALLSHR